MRWCPRTAVSSCAASGFRLVQGVHRYLNSSLQDQGRVVVTMCSFGFWSLLVEDCTSVDEVTHFRVRQGCSEASPCLLWSLSWLSFVLNRKTPNTGLSKKEEAVLLVSIKCSFQSYIEMPRRCCFVILDIILRCGLLDYCDCIQCYWL